MLCCEGVTLSNPISDRNSQDLIIAKVPKAQKASSSAFFTQTIKRARKALRPFGEWREREKHNPRGERKYREANQTLTLVEQRFLRRFSQKLLRKPFLISARK